MGGERKFSGKVNITRSEIFVEHSNSFKRAPHQLNKIGVVIIITPPHGARSSAG